MAEVRDADRRPDDVCRPGSIAGQLRVEDSGVRKRLGDRFVEFPAGELDGTEGGFPADGSWRFLERDLAPGMERRWPWLRTFLRQGMWGYEWVRKHSPDGVLVWNDSYPLTRGACMAANDIGVPSMEIIHGLTHVYRIGHWETKAVAEWKFGTPEYAKWAEFYGLGAQVVVTGSPVAVPYTDVDVERVRATARFELKIPEGAPTVCFLCDAAFGRSAWGEQGYSIGVFVEAAKALGMLQQVIPDLHIIVKLHPNETHRRGVEQYEAALKSVGVGDNYTIIDDPLAVAIGAADLTLGAQSTAMSIGLLLGVPGLVIAHEPFFPRWLYEGRGIAVTTHRDVIRDIAELLGGEGRMEKLIDETKDGAKFFTGNTDGLAGSRIALAVESIVDKGEVPDAAWA